jgi:heme exporter protein B
MTGWLAIVRRELRRGWSSGSWWLPVAFFLLVATLFPFAVGPNATLLARVGGGILWVAMLLATLLPIDRLVTPDLDAGVIDRMVMAGISEEAICAAKLIAHLIGFALPLALALPVAAVLLAIPGEALTRFAIGFAVAAPGLAALTVMIASLTASLRSSGGLAGMMLLPLAVPLLIFGAGALDPAARGAMLYLAAVSLLLTAAAPFAAGAALRAAREG